VSSVPQSALDAHGPQAEIIATLAWTMFAAGAVILVVVTVLALLAVFARPSSRRWIGRRSLVIGGGIVVPVVALSALLVYGLDVFAAVTRLDPSPVRRVEIVGERWWWRVHYLDERGQPVFAAANELRLPVGETVELILVAHDVIHSFWVPSLAGKLDMIPGKVNRLRLRADRPGTFRAQCAEYCGGAHAMMALYVVAERPEDFRQWMSRQGEPARPAETAELSRGRDAFLARGCGSCHAVRGTEAAGTIGPDLTHVGSRRSIGAGLLPNNAGTLAAWIADSQHLKPENLMPSFTGLRGEELRAIALWLASLE
jgi:cytochrome c oxidase subunit II